MIEMRRRCMCEKEPYIPAKYQQVEYLESSPIYRIERATGPVNPLDSAYLNTNVITDENTSVVIRYAFLGWWNSHKESQIGCGGSSSRYVVGVFADNSGVSRFQFAMNLQVKTDFEIVFGEKYEMELNPILNIARINNNIYSSTTKPSVSNRPFGIFCRIQDLEFTNITYNVGGRCYYCLIKQYDNPIRELIPCYRKEDLVAGMYDRVNDVFYANAGTGSFIVGPDVN